MTRIQAAGDAKTLLEKVDKVPKVENILLVGEFEKVNEKYVFADIFRSKTSFYPFICTVTLKYMYFSVFFLRVLMKVSWKPLRK